MELFNDLLFQKRVEETAEKMLYCNFYKNGCFDVSIDLDEFIFPRCLLWEQKDSTKTGAAIIGINPGQLKDKEKKHYKKWDKTQGSLYQAFITLWNSVEDTKKVPFYRRLKMLLRDLPIEGSILWGELAHCQNKIAGINPSNQTRGICSNNHLFPLLNDLPSDWPIIAVGKEVFNTLSVIYYDRLVIGVPHVTGSRGHFNRLFVSDSLSNEFKLNSIYQRGNIYNRKGAVWLAK